MERRNLLAGLMLVLVSMFMLTGTAFAHKAHHKRVKPALGAPAPESCVVFAEPGSFVDQGEFGTASSIADIISVECEPVYAEHFVTISATELYSRCDKELSWSEGIPYAPLTGPSYTIKLDNDGNGGAVVWGGPSCAPGESLITAELDEAPFTTVTTAFTVLPPAVTAPGVKAEPPTTVEGEETSTAATIVEVEFPPVYAERLVDINARELYNRCQIGPKLVWVGPDEKVEAEETPDLREVKLDNDGNAFVVLLGGESCASGTSLIEASLENAPYTTYTTTFTIEPPRVTFP